MSSGDSSNSAAPGEPLPMSRRRLHTIVSGSSITTHTIASAFIFLEYTFFFYKPTLDW